MLLHDHLDGRVGRFIHNIDEVQIGKLTILVLHRFLMHFALPNRIVQLKVTQQLLLIKLGLLLAVVEEGLLPCLLDD